eukprot:2514111-Rhodomonas_salina.1
MARYMVWSVALQGCSKCLASLCWAFAASAWIRSLRCLGPVRAALQPGVPAPSPERHRRSTGAGARNGTRECGRRGREMEQRARGSEDDRRSKSQRESARKHGRMCLRERKELLLVVRRAEAAPWSSEGRRRAQKR